MNEKTVTLSLRDWERVDMALDIAVMRSSAYGSPDAMVEYQTVQQEIYRQMFGEEKKEDGQ